MSFLETPIKFDAFALRRESVKQREIFWRHILVRLPILTIILKDTHIVFYLTNKS